MALFNYANREITAKIVYYGPGVCGKTTSLQYIHERIAPVQRGRLLSLATETDRTIFFDLLPLKLGEIRGFKLRFQLYTVPGQVKYNKTRKLVLQGADAIVFVADSQVNRREKNLESFRNLQDNLAEQGKSLDDLPIVYEYNKRDLDHVLSIEQLNQDLNPQNLPHFQAVATKGMGVMETLEAISKIALSDIEQRLTANTKAETEQEEPEDFTFTDDDLLDLTADDAALEADGLSLSDDLDALEFDSDLEVSGDDDALESKPIGYDKAIQIEEFAIQPDMVAQTGTLKESEFFDLKDIEEQALRELDEFIDGSSDDVDFGGGDFESGGDGLAFDAFGDDLQDSELEADDSDMFGDSNGAAPLSGFGFADSGADDGDDDDGLDFSFSAASLDRDAPSEDVGNGDGGLDFSFSASPLGDEADDDLDAGGDLDFSFGAADDTPPSGAKGAADDATLDFGASMELDSLLDFTLGDDDGTGADAMAETAEDIEPLEFSEDDLDFSDAVADMAGPGEHADAEDDLPSFTLSDDDAEDEAAAEPLSAGDELAEFTLDDALDVPAGSAPFEASSAVSEIESLNLSDADLDLSFDDDDEDEDEGKAAFASLSGLNMAGEESGPPYDFRITDSVRFEMQHSEKISAVTPFEKQLDELSDDMFTAEDEGSRGDFEPEPARDAAAEEFQALTDARKRQLVIAKHLYRHGELARARQTTSDHIQAVMMYYLAVETALKAVALKYDACNPAVASLKIILDSIEEETEKSISGKKSVLENIVALKDGIQLETAYPDQDACELAARICDRFLSTLAEEFLAVDLNELSPILPEPVEN